MQNIPGLKRPGIKYFRSVLRGSHPSAHTWANKSILYGCFSAVYTLAKAPVCIGKNFSCPAVDAKGNQWYDNHNIIDTIVQCRKNATAGEAVYGYNFRDSKGKLLHDLPADPVGRGNLSVHTNEHRESDIFAAIDQSSMAVLRIYPLFPKGRKAPLPGTSLG